MVDNMIESTPIQQIAASEEIQPSLIDLHAAGPSISEANLPCPVDASFKGLVPTKSTSEHSLSGDPKPEFMTNEDLEIEHLMGETDLFDLLRDQKSPMEADILSEAAASANIGTPIQEDYYYFDSEGNFHFNPNFVCNTPMPELLEFEPIGLEYICILL
jgi:hypothetical protein